MTEPTPALLGGSTPARIAQRYGLATRPKFFTASVLPFLIGSSWGWISAGSFDLTAFALALVAVIFVHAAANVLNDVFDDLNGNDGGNTERLFPYTGGSRFIQNGVLSNSQMARWGVLLLVIGVTAGLLLTSYKGIEIIYFGLVGVGLAILYSAPPFSLSARGFGEIAVAIAFGTLPVAGAVWLQTGVLDNDALMVSVPVSMWVAAILIINEVPDASADAAVNRKTLVVRFGSSGAKVMYILVQTTAFAGFVAMYLQGLIPVWGLAFPAALLLGTLKVSGGISGTIDSKLRQSIEQTLAMHMLGCLWLLALITGKAFWW